MKKIAILAMAAASFATMPLVPDVSVTTAEAATPTLHQIAREGYRACRALPHGWKGKVRADEYGDHNAFDRVNITYCFRTQAECAGFVNNIERIAYPVNLVYYRNCRPY